MEPLYFQSCEDVDTYFREGREFFNETYVKKLAQTSTYFTRLKSATWPMNSGTTQKGFRFGRGFFDPTTPWRKVESKRCETNSCDSAPDKIIRPGTDSYFFDLLRKELVTDWICVEDLMYRLLPAEEIMQFEESNARITLTVHEEFARTTYVGASAHKWISFVDPDDEYCAVSDDAGWFMEQNAGTGEGGFDSRFLRVKSTVADLERIAFLSLDLLDDSLVDLAEEDDLYRLDMRDAGIMKLDIIVPEPRVARRMFVQAKQSNGFWNTDAEFDKQLSDLRLGIHRTISDYAFGYDSNALRYNVDTAFNATLSPFDANDSDTWPRLVRVPRYRQVPAEIGYVYIPNTDYRKADFGISICWAEKAMQKWMNPNSTGHGSVKMEDQNYAGDFDWRRPDWECNRWGKMGFFQAQFRLAMQVKDPTIMHSFLHRIDNSRNFTASGCPLQTYVAPAPIDNYECQGTIVLP